MLTKITIIKGDITKLKVGAIVNAANKTLLGGGGVDGVIHQAAGPKLLEECKTLDGCQTGEAKITKGYNLRAQYIIHTVGPIFGQEKGQEYKLLKKSYISSLNLAKTYNIRTLAFPAISTGVYRFPKEKAVELVHKTIINYLTENGEYFNEIVFVLHSNKNYQLYKNKFKHD